MNRSVSFFALQWRFQKWVMELSCSEEKLQLIDRIYKISWIALVGLMILAPIIGTPALVAIFVIGTCYLTCRTLPDAFRTLTTVRGIFTTGLIATFLLGLFFAGCIFELTTYPIKDDGQYLLLCFCCTIAWIVISSFFNAQIATLVNGISGSLLSLIMSSKRIFWLYLSPSLLRNLSPADLAAFQARGYSPEQLLYDVIDCFLFPFLLASAAGAIFCLIKCYWIKEFNNGNDINRHRIIK